MKKIYFLLLSLVVLFTNEAISQCTNGPQFGTVTAPTGASAVTISSCSFQSEYATINSVVAGNRYEVTASIAGTFITIRYNTPTGTAVAAGVSPLQFTAPCSGTYYSHWNTNAACGTASVCMTTTISCSSCGGPSSQCANASSFGTVTAPTTINVPTTISSCSFQQEYSTINSVVANRVYRVTASIPGTFITIRQGSSNGTVIASGVSPLVFTSTVAGTYYSHWNTNNSCGTAASCMTTDITYINDAVCVGPPTNDDCSTALTINCGQTLSGNTNGATVDVVPTCVTGLSTAPGLWYTFVGDGSNVTLSLCGSAYDTKIGVFTGTCAALTCVTGNDDFCGLQSQVSFSSVSGTTYYVIVTGFGSASGAFTLTRTCVVPVVNDACAGAINIDCGQTIVGTTVGATPDAVPTCGTTLNTAAGVWYKFIGTGSNNVLSLCGSSYDTKIGVFTGTCAGLVCVAGNDDFCGLSSQVTVPTTAGTQYYVLVTGFSTAQGAFTLNRSCFCTGVPSPGVISGPGATVCSGSSVTLTLSGYTSAAGISFQWKSSATPGGPYTNIAGATGTSYTFNANTTAYFVVTVTCSTGPNNATTAEFTLNVSKPVHSNVLATPAVGCAPASSLITGTVSGGVTTANYTHTLTGPGTIVQNAPSGPFNSNASFSVTNIPAGTNTYTLTSTDAIGCSVSSTVQVVVNVTPTVTVIPTAATICNGAIQRIDASAVPQIQQTFTNTTNIQIPPGGGTSGIANPYPSAITVSGLPTVGSSVRSVTLSTYYHANPDDVDVVLVSPTGQAVILMSDCGGSTPATGQTFVLSDAAAANLADNAFNPSGNYKPTNYDNLDNWPAPGPGSSPTATTLSTFTGNMNGTWSLYVVDDLTGATGLISSWSMTFDLTAPVVFSPLTNLFTDAAATIAYTGTPVYTVWAKPTTTTTYTASYTANGCTGTATSVITVNQLPAITSQPAAVAASCPGFNVTYTVGATGTGLTYQWQVSTNGGTTWTDLTNSPLTYAGVTTNTLTVINPQASQDNYQYRVNISGTCPPAVTSSAVTMRIGNPPTITSLTTNPAVPTICQNQNISFTVVAAGSPIAPTIYQWQVSTDAGVTWTNLTTGGSYTSTFTITNATTALNNNRYRVIVTNPCGQSVTSATVTLTVNPLPTVTSTALTNRICLSDTLIPLVGSPVGGSWSGPGVSGFNFIPSATGIGQYTLTYSYTSTLGCTNTSSFIVKVEDCPERIRRLIDNALILFPNPNNGRFNIKVNSTLYNYLGMRVYNTAGETVRVQYFNSLVYGRVVPINISDLPSGVYIVKFYYDDGIRSSEKSWKVIIQK